jgi:hypothetical protein
MRMEGMRVVDEQQEEIAHQQEEMRRREEDIRRKMEERRRQEQEGIIRRQQEADAAASAARALPSAPIPISYPSSSRNRSGSVSSQILSHSHPARARSPSTSSNPPLLSYAHRDHSRARSPPPAVPFPHSSGSAAQQTAYDWRRRQEGDGIPRRQDIGAEFGTSASRQTPRPLGPSATISSVLDDRRRAEGDGIGRRPQEMEVASWAARQRHLHEPRSASVPPFMDEDYGAPPRRVEADGISRRQQEADAAERAARSMHDNMRSASVPPFNEDELYMSLQQPAVTIMPLEDPNRFEEDTDQSGTEGGGLFIPRPRHPSQPSHPSLHARRPSRK